MVFPWTETKWMRTNMYGVFCVKIKLQRILEIVCAEFGDNI